MTLFPSVIQWDSRRGLPRFWPFILSSLSPHFNPSWSRNYIDQLPWNKDIKLNKIFAFYIDLQRVSGIPSGLQNVLLVLCPYTPNPFMDQTWIYACYSMKWHTMLIEMFFVHNIMEYFNIYLVCTSYFISLLSTFDSKMHGTKYRSSHCSRSLFFSSNQQTLSKGLSWYLKF